MLKYFSAIFGLCCVVALTTQCTLDEDFNTDAGLMLRLGQDTVRFDTVFTEVGSATRSFKLFNPSDQPVSIRAIKVVNSAGGRFRINVDGLAGPEVNDIFLPPSDSIYVFVEVTVDPDDDVSVSPFVFEGQVSIQATQQVQTVYLEAFGQNANYLPSDRTRANFGVLACNMGEISFDDPKPYVLYGSLIVDECTLVLPKGTRLYVHGGLVQNPELFPTSPIFNDGLIIFQNSGKLRIEGTASEPVLIATDRLEPQFQQQGGQYSGIRLGSGTGPHRISHTRIRNGIVGVFVDSTAELSIDHSIINYTTSAGIVGYQANVSMSNVLLHDNGGGALQAIKGGNYTVDYCTIVNYSGQNPAVALTTGFQITNELSLLANLDAKFQNSIVYGSLGDEFAVGDFNEPDLLAYSISNCILRSDRVPQLRPEFNDRCTNCLFPTRDEPLFVNTSQDSFQLDSMSVGRRYAQPITGIDDDLIGTLRNGTNPDAGAYEYLQF